MKILAIVGSPRGKGKTYQAVQRVEEELRALDEVDFEYVHLKDVNLDECRGCHLCCTRGEDLCPLDNDRAALEAKMGAADGVILASPVYAQQVTWLMKKFIDLYAYMWHRPRLFGVKMMGVTTGGGQFKETLSYLAQNARAWGAQPVAEVGVPHMDSLTPRFRAKTERSIAKAAQRFHRALQGPKHPSPRLGDLMWFRMWRINARVNEEALPADHAYWMEHGWFEADYYYPASIGPFKRAVAYAGEKALRLFMRQVYVGY